jgi:hypothetical protein
MSVCAWIEQSSASSVTALSTPASPVGYWLLTLASVGESCRHVCFVQVPAALTFTTDAVMTAIDAAGLGSFKDAVALKLFDFEEVKLSDLSGIVASVGIPGSAALTFKKILLNPSTPVAAVATAPIIEVRAVSYPVFRCYVFLIDVLVAFGTELYLGWKCRVGNCCRSSQA